MHDASPPLRVLVVDDQPELLSSLVAALSVAGHQCTPVASAEAAIACCADTRFDCILLDEVLGLHSGLELAATLRGTATQRDARIVMVSGLQRQFFDEALGDGIIDGYLEKPVGLGELLDAVVPRGA